MLDLYLQQTSGPMSYEQSLITHFGNVRAPQNWRTTRQLFPTVGVSN